MGADPRRKLRLVTCRRSQTACGVARWFNSGYVARAVSKRQCSLSRARSSPIAFSRGPASGLHQYRDAAGATGPITQPSKDARRGHRTGSRATGLNVDDSSPNAVSAAPSTSWLVSLTAASRLSGSPTRSRIRSVTRYLPLDQIRKDNARNLHTAWRHAVGGAAAGSRSRMANSTASAQAAQQDLPPVFEPTAA